MTDDDSSTAPSSVVDPEVVRQGYDELADSYTAERSTVGTDVDVLASFLEDLPPSARVLDAGCGGGRPVLERLTADYDAVGIDVSAEQLRLAASVAPAAGLLQGDMARLPLVDGSVDAIVAYHSVIHVPLAEQPAVVEEFARVLAPGGRLLLTEGPQEWTGTNPDWLDAGVEMQWEIAGIDATREQLRTAGFSIVDEHDAGHELADEDEHWIYVHAERDGGVESEDSTGNRGDHREGGGP